MNVVKMTVDEQLAEIDALIERERRRPGHTATDRPFVALKLAAQDMRGRRTDNVCRAQDALQRVVTNAARGDQRAGQLQRIGEEVLAHWSVIRQALKRFAETAEASR